VETKISRTKIAVGSLIR